jgi:hypothetical protein
VIRRSGAACDRLPPALSIASAIFSRSRSSLAARTVCSNGSGASAAGACRLREEALGDDHATGIQQHGALDPVLELPNIPRPPSVAHQPRQRRGRERLHAHTTRRAPDPLVVLARGCLPERAAGRTVHGFTPASISSTASGLPSGPWSTPRSPPGSPHRCGADGSVVSAR